MKYFSHQPDAMDQSDTYALMDASHKEMCNWASERDSCINCMNDEVVCTVASQPSFVLLGSCCSTQLSEFPPGEYAIDTGLPKRHTRSLSNV